MQKKGFRWELIAISAVLTLAVLSLAHYTYESVGVIRPLEQALLLDPDVSAVTFTRDADSDVAVVTLSKVADLSVTYARLENLITDKAGEGVFSIELMDARDATLQDMYHSIHYYLEEASARGNFGTMIEACGPVLDKAGAAGYKITVDESHIYVQIETASGYLYQVLDRMDEPATGGAV